MKSRSPFRRPCLTCGRLGSPGESRCDICKQAKEQERKALRGATPIANKVRYELNKVSHHNCAQCTLEYPVSYLKVDHIKPLRDGGRDSLENLQILCDDCHTTKTTQEARERRRFI